MSGQAPLPAKSLDRFEEIEGLIPRRSGRALAMLALTVPDDQVIVEIGSYKGKSACYLASGSAHVFALDAWDTPGNPSGRFGFAESETYEEFERNLARLDMEDRISPIKGFAVELAEDWPPAVPIGLLFIDGDHGETNETAPLDDFRAWRPHLAAGAIVVFDDWDGKHPGVDQAVERLQSEGFSFERQARRLAVTKMPTTKGHE